MKIGTHEFSPAGISINIQYYTCAECGLIIFKTLHLGYLTSSKNASNLDLRPEDITCTDWTIRDIIQ